MKKIYKPLSMMFLCGLMWQQAYAANNTLMSQDACFRTARLPIPVIHGSFYGSPSPSEAYNSNRTHLYPYSCTPQELGGKNPIVQKRSLSGVEQPYNVVTREREELFLYGGSQGSVGLNAPRAYVAKINADTLTQTWRADIQQENVSWNYPGALLVHKDGFLYVVYSNYLKKVDPATGAILGSTKLPTANNDDANSTYNGLVVDDNGHIILKSVNRSVGCKEDGINAFFKCPLSRVTSMLVSVDSSTMKTIDSVEIGENIGPRISYFKHYAYIAGASDISRFAIDKSGKFAYDEKWGKVRYTEEGQTSGTAPGIATIEGEDYVIIQTNSNPTATPQSIVAISTKDSSIKSSIKPFEPEYPGQISQMLSMVTIDEENQMIYAADGSYGKFAGIKISAGPKFEVVWTKDIKTYDFTNLVGPKKSRVLVTTDCTEDEKYSRFKWLDAKTGELITEADYVVSGKGLPLEIGYNGRFYQVGYDGVLTEWSFTRS